MSLRKLGVEVWDIEKVFNEDIKEKRIIASGVYSKTGKRGYVGKMLFPSDLMNRKEKYRYRKAGKVVVYNMYDTIMSFEEFLKLSEEEQKKALIEYRKRFTNRQITNTWGIGEYKIYEIMQRLDVPRSRSGKRKDSAKVRNQEQPQTQLPAPVAVSSQQPTIPLKISLDIEINIKVNYNQ
jgi:hypothetical protein